MQTRQQRFRERNPHYDRDWHRKKGQDYRRNSWLKWRYGITLAEYNAILTKQGGKCAVSGCNEPPGGRGKRYHVDHDHKNKRVRGLLCSNCNRALGLLRECQERIEGLAVYLKEHS